MSATSQHTTLSIAEAVDIDHLNLPERLDLRPRARGFVQPYEG